MSKRLILMLSLALGIGLIASIAYAEVQNIKVSGDLTTLALSRYGFNLTNEPGDISALATIIRVRFDADLTDDVAVVVRLINEREWGSADEGAANSDIDLDLAYVTLKEFLYSPRQELRLGSGLIVGDPDTNRVASAASNFTNTLTDLSARKAFDGIVGILDYAPLTLTLGYLKIQEDLIADNTDEENVYLVNAAYDFGDARGAVGELYYIVKDSKHDEKMNAGDAQNIGVRVTSTPIDNLDASAEFVHQSHKSGIATRSDGNSLSDSALLLGVTYSLPDMTGTPTIGVDYTRLGENWDVMYEDQTPADIANAIFQNTNLQVIGVTATAKPMEDVALRLRYANLRMIEGGTLAASNHGGYTLNGNKKVLGNEIDLSFTYDYTEDVQLGLDLGYFDAGSAFNDRENATQVIGSMKVTF